MDYELELEKAENKINEIDARTVLIQFPEGIKQKAPEVAGILEKKTKASIHIWAGTCFGACDIPHVKGYDLLIQWGHSEFQR